VRTAGPRNSEQRYRFGGAGFENGIEGVGFGGTELPGFFPEAEDGVVQYPFEVGGEEPDVGGKGNFASDCFGLLRITADFSLVLPE